MVAPVLLPAFSIHHRLSDWPECRLELHCPSGSGSTVDYPVRLLLMERGDRPFLGLVSLFRCRCCGQPPAPAYLVAGLMRRSDSGGGGACWAVELVAPRAPLKPAAASDKRTT